MPPHLQSSFTLIELLVVTPIRKAFHAFVRGKSPSNPKASFTLIELLVVIAILAVLATAVVLVLNPAQLLAQGRDSTRLSDLAALNSALSLFQVDAYTQSLGTPNTVYISVPDNASSTCGSLGLPSLPSPWAYHCVPASSSTKVDGTGWIPVNLTLISSGSPLSKLPIDPVNTTSTGLYYTYVSGGSYEITSAMESQKYRLGGSTDAVSTDGGPYPDLREIGSNLSLLPIDYGDTSLVGYWPFNEGTGLTAYDASGHGNNGALSASPPAWITGKLGGALSFNGSNNYVSYASSSGNVYGPITVAAWVYVNPNSTYQFVIQRGTSGANVNCQYSLYVVTTNVLRFSIDAGANEYPANSSVLTAGWYYVVGTWTGSGPAAIYINGVNAGNSASVSGTQNSISNFIMGNSGGGGYPFNGYLDDVRVYNRALSAAEIQAIYNAQK